MNIKTFLTILLFFILNSCADYKTTKVNKSIDEVLYYSKGFALIYKDKYFNDGTINQKLNSDDFTALHSLLKRNSLVKIINPINSKVIELKIYKRANYPKIFNIVINDKIASFLDLDVNNPYVEIFELRKNKKFIAKESNIFEEEKNVANTAPVSEIEMDNLSEVNTIDSSFTKKKSFFFLTISDFYYFETANNLKENLRTKTKINKFLVKKISNNKYRLSVGPFKNFNALKSAYISLNNLGFENLNVYNNE